MLEKDEKRSFVFEDRERKKWDEYGVIANLERKVSIK